ncbi:MAG: aspartate--tRNA ligase [Spirochaetales bacterium]|jgi:aspartyl-tRNA synthetase|nr:aspartate--tRNA ligase [Spirochaetales bacterium]
MENYKRTHSCGELRLIDANKRVILNGWVHRIRDHGGIHFINLRDRYGITQVVVNPGSPESLLETVRSLKPEYCIAVKGKVLKRPRNMVNHDMPTGEIEVEAREIVILSQCAPLPFVIDDKTDARDEARIKYRYLDLRSFSMQRKIRLRHRAAFAVREFLEGEEFYEIETPTLIKSTPEGARDFLVPARLFPGKFFALPQSPQLFKQILMVGGLDRYFQLARCYRDEDARGDRQLEFTQIDIEMSFVDREDVLSLTEGLYAHLFKKVLGAELSLPFPRLSFAQAMDRFGTDKPDGRFALELGDFSPWAGEGEFGVFQEALAGGGTVKYLAVPEGENFTRKGIAELEETAKTYGAGGLAWMRVVKTPEGRGALEGGIAKFFAPRQEAIISALGLKEGTLLLFSAGPWKTACQSLGAVRLKLGRDLGLIDKNRFHFLWVVDFPLFEYSEENQGWKPAHHMFSMPQKRFLPTLEENPGEVLGDLYDLVLNGYELGSGSIRIHDPELQKRIFRIIGLSDEEAEKRFGFLLKAFAFGAPPHGGIAAGFDRTVMLMAGEESIREVIPFPKNTQGASPMEESPAEVDPRQLEELGLQIRGKTPGQERQT